MIEPGEALEIVRDSIIKTVGDNENYSSDKPLAVFGIIAPETLSTFKLIVRRDDEVGVRAHDHTLAAAELDSITTDSPAGNVEEIILNKAVPIEEMDIQLAEIANKGSKKTKKSKKGKEVKFICQVKLNIFS
jgi:hypothetical protein